MVKRQREQMLPTVAAALRVAIGPCPILLDLLYILLGEAIPGLVNVLDRRVGHVVPVILHQPLAGEKPRLGLKMSDETTEYNLKDRIRHEAESNPTIDRHTPVYLSKLVTEKSLFSDRLRIVELFRPDVGGRSANTSLVLKLSSMRNTTPVYSKSL